MQALIDTLSKLGDNQSVVIGSDGQADVIIPGSGIDPRHARLSRRNGTLLVQDLDSRTGTFINGQEVRGWVEVRPGDRLRLGSVEVPLPHLIQTQSVTALGSVGSAPRVAPAPIAVSLIDGTKKVGARPILDNVSFHLNPGEFLGILGASGSGKSTLIKTVAGLVELTSGAILLDGQPVAPQALRGDHRVAYLPQDVVIHEALTPQVALDYVARLKGLGQSPGERRQLVQHALERVGLWEKHRDTVISRLSGGQRKRAALAAELLGDPRLILLDEATSGLDPATEEEMMELFRSLAREGRTVICITHFPGRLHLCDKLLYLMQGKCVFFGTPAELKAFFGVDGIEDVYTKQHERTAEEWEGAFRRSPVGQRAAAGVPHVAVDAPPPPPLASPVSWEHVVQQARDLTARYFRLQLADLKNLFLLFAQAPVIGLMVGLTFGSIKASFAEQHAADTKQVIFVVVLAVLWCAGTASVREIVKEMPILQHETRFGVGLAPYLLSKFVLLGVLTLVQTAVLLLTVRYFTSLTGLFDVQFLVLAFTALSGVALGLLVSAVAGTSERAMTLLPVLLIGQAIFSGGLARLAGPALAVARLIVPAYWSLDGLKTLFASDLSNATYPGAPGTFQPPILGPGGPLVLDLIALTGLTLFFLLATYLALQRQVFNAPWTALVWRVRARPGGDDR